jgi:integrase
MPGAGAFGPYRRGARWRVVVRARDGARTTASFATEAAARRYLDAARLEVEAERDGDRTVGRAIDAYQKHLEVDKGNRSGSVGLTRHRLRVLFAPDLEGALGDLTPQRGKWLNDRLVTATYEKGGETRRYSVDTCRNTLAEAKTFLEWCVGQRWLRKNALEGVKGKGKRKHGKAQLTIDEARKWSAEALRQAEAGDAGAIAALLTVTLGLRASEITRRKVRDLDDGGRLLRVTEAKTDAGVRVVEVPEVVRTFLHGLAANRPGEDLLFGHHWRDWPRENVQRICKAVGVQKVTAHGMRGLHATLAVQAGATAHLVAAALGHESEKTTLESYAKREAVEESARRSALTVLKGGR